MLFAVEFKCFYIITKFKLAYILVQSEQENPLIKRQKQGKGGRNKEEGELTKSSMESNHQWGNYLRDLPCLSIMQLLKDDIYIPDEGP